MACLRRILIGLLIPFLSHCKHTSSEVKAYVTPSQFAATYALINDLKTYVPFSEPGTCFARALYMAMILATQEIPSSARYVFAPSPQDPLRGPNNVAWNYHVAVMIHATDSQEDMIIDPSLSPTPLVDWQWVKLMTDKSPRMLNVPGSVYASRVQGGEFFDNVTIRSFAEMPPFRESDIEQACGEIERFQHLLGGKAVAAARNKLHTETIRFVKNLAQLKKVDFGVLTPNMIYCGKTKIYAGDIP